MQLIISNTWSHVARGHAQHELFAIYNFVKNERSNIQLVKLTTRESFKNRLVPFGLLGHNLKLDRSQFLKKRIDNKLLSDLASLINVKCHKELVKSTQVSIISCRYQHVFPLLKKLDVYDSISLRILDSPSNEYEWISFQKKVSSTIQRTVFAWEDYETSILASSFFESSVHLPNALSLEIHKETKSNPREYVGVFWPIASNYSEDEVRKLLLGLQGFKVKIKIAERYKYLWREFNDRNGYIWIGDDISDERLLKELASIKVGILPHRGYFNRGSGYASYFATNSVPFLTHPENSFYKNLAEYDEVIALPHSSVELRESVSRILENKLDDSIKKNYFSYSKRQWRKFLCSDAGNEC